MEVRLNSPVGKLKRTYSLIALAANLKKLTCRTVKSILLQRTFLVLSISEEETEKLTVAQVFVKMSLNKSRW